MKSLWCLFHKSYPIKVVTLRNDVLYNPCHKCKNNMIEQQCNMLPKFHKFLFYLSLKTNWMIWAKQHTSFYRLELRSERKKRKKRKARDIIKKWFEIKYKKEKIYVNRAKLLPLNLDNGRNVLLAIPKRESGLSWSKGHRSDEIHRSGLRFRFLTSILSFIFKLKSKFPLILCFFSHNRSTH